MNLKRDFGNGKEYNIINSWEPYLVSDVRVNVNKNESEYKMNKVKTPKNKTWYTDLKISDYQFVIYDIDADAVIHEFDISNENELRHALKVLKYHREERKDNVWLNITDLKQQQKGNRNE